MSALTRLTHNPFRAIDWQPSVTQLLDDGHLAAWSRDRHRRVHFAAALSQFLESQTGNEVCRFYGRHITDLDSFCHQLERCVAGPPLSRRIDGPGGVVGLLRARQTLRHQRAPRVRYYVWSDADTLLRSDAKLFGALVDAIAGVAAEAEYVSDEMLFLQRAVLIGDSILDVYGDDPRGQFRSWREDDMGEPFWKVVTGLEQPPVSRFPIDTIDDL